MKKWLVCAVMAMSAAAFAPALEAGHHHRHHGYRVYRAPVAGYVPYGVYRPPVVYRSYRPYGAYPPYGAYAPYGPFGVPGLSLGVAVGRPYGMYRPAFPVAPFPVAPFGLPGYYGMPRSGGVIILR
jgi:hypothetical protein